jgi:four helix bundle protein
MGTIINFKDLDLWKDTWIPVNLIYAEFSHFLNILKGSSGEVKNMYYIAEDQKYIDPTIVSDRKAGYQKLMNSPGGFIRYLNTRK